MQQFIGRSSELSVLSREYQKDTSFVVLYGRRRVGKTTLIREFIKDKKALYFLATEEMEAQNMKRFNDKLAVFTNQSYLKKAVFSDWASLFEIFSHFQPNEKKVLVIDEFQYLVQVNPAFPSIFQQIWDEIMKDNNIMVILCGSLISMMQTHVLSYNSPLYGRRTAQIKLKPIRFSEMALAYPSLRLSEMVEFFAVTGGVPKYFEFFDNDSPLNDNITQHILKKSSFLYEEPFFLLEKEVREPINYFSIIRTISEGNRKLSKIASSLAKKSSDLSPYLNTLIDLDLIEKRVPATEKHPEKSRKGLYFITDYFINFWFNFVYPFRGELELDMMETAIDKLNRSFIESYVSFIYEDICRDIFADLCQDKTIPFTPGRIGAYWNNNIEIDLLAINYSDNIIFAGECKYYQNKPVSLNVYAALIEKCKIAEFNHYTVFYILFSISGFDQRLIDLAKENDQLILVNERNRIC